MGLLEQIEQRSKEISTDSYSMSVGELLSMYRDGELLLRPEFQRLFRWSIEQKSRFIESLLLGIPIPSIFVSQTKEGKWEVIDGLQRLSTLFEVAGELCDEYNVKKNPLTLTRTKYLPGLDGLKWKSEDPNFALPEEAKLRIKRSRIDVNIVLSTSDNSAKYEMFQRLNTGGSLATDQEVRNAILVMINREFYRWISELAKYENFRACIPLTERALDEQFDFELVTRFIVLRSLSQQQLREIGDLGEFLTEKIVEMAENESFDRDEVSNAFYRTFDVLAKHFGENSFKKYDQVKNVANGAMLISIFEVLAIGLGTYAGDLAYSILEDGLAEIQKELPKKMTFTTSGSGIRASTRIPTTIALGRELFAP